MLCDYRPGKIIVNLGGGGGCWLQISFRIATINLRLCRIFIGCLRKSLYNLSDVPDKASTQTQYKTKYRSISHDFRSHLEKSVNGTLVLVG